MASNYTRHTYPMPRRRRELLDKLAALDFIPRPVAWSLGGTFVRTGRWVIDDLYGAVQRKGRK